MPKYSPSEEYIESLTRSYYDPYSSAPINLGLALRQNLAQIAARKKLDEEKLAAQRKEEFERWVKEQELKLRLSQLSQKTPEEQAWEMLTPEQKIEAAKNKFSLTAKSAYSPEARSIIEQQIGLPAGILATAPDSAVTQALNELQFRKRPKEPKESTAKKLDPYLVEVQNIKQFYNQQRAIAYREFKASLGKLGVDFKKGKLTKEAQLARMQANEDYKSLLKSLEMEEANALREVAKTFGEAPPEIKEPTEPPGPLVGYDKNGNPLYRGPDGKLYRKQ